jgi:hypothetical protein
MEEIRRSATTGMRNRKIIAGAAMGALSLIMAVVYNFSPSQYGFYPRCPFYAATHLLCPGCGATRALYSILHGDLRTALHYNALFTVLAPVLLAGFAFCCYRVMRHDRFPRLVVPHSVMVGLGIVALLFAIGRNTIFTF